MELATARTTLRPWHHDEAARLLDIQSRVEVMRWLDDDQEHPRLLVDEGEAHARIDRYHAQSDADGPVGFWAIEERATATVAGTVLLTTAGDGRPHPVHGAEELEIGWHLHPDSWGRGLAREAAAALLDAGLASGISPVHALLYPDNEPSARVCRAIGMVEQPIEVDTWYPGESRHFLAVGPGDRRG